MWLIFAGLKTLPSISKVRVVKTYSLHGLKILSQMSGRRVFALYGPIERRPIVTSRFTETRKRSEQKETKEFEQKETKLTKLKHLPSGSLGPSVSIVRTVSGPCRLVQPAAAGRRV